jgi:hypothetical protein
MPVINKLVQYHWLRQHVEVKDPAQTTVYQVYLALAKDSYIKEQIRITNKTDQLIAQIITEAEDQIFPGGI